MSFSSRNLVPLALALTLSLFLTTPTLAFQPGEQAGGFSLQNLAGETVSLSDFKGRLVVLELGTTWCPGCRFQNKEMAKIASLFDRQQVQVLEIFMQETAKNVRGYLEELDLKGDGVLLDDGSVQKGYNVYLIPRVLIIDADGKVRFDAGMTESSIIEKKLRELLPQ